MIVSRFLRLVSTSLWALILLSQPLTVNADSNKRIHVAVASNFAPLAVKLAHQFKQQSDIEIITFASSSGAAYAQIVQGAPFDLFLSADTYRPEQLERLGHIVEGSRSTYARGVLVLWAPNQQLPAANHAELSNWLLTQSRVAIANPKIAPYGDAAIRVFEAIGIEQQIKYNTVMGSNVFQAYQYVFTGNPPVGLVGRHLVQDRPNVLALPEDLYPSINQQLVVLKRSDLVTEAMAFRAFLLSAQVQQQIINAGFARGDS